MRIWRTGLSLALLSAGLLSISCGRKHHRVKTARQPLPRHPISVPVGTTEQGLASWYGVPYHGRPAADGEIYDMETLVAAHRTLPFNTWLKVTNLNNGRSVNVRVIDRGPFVKGRIIDLSKAAARQIQMLGPGVARVRIEVISAPADIPSDDFYAVQVGAFANQANAEKLRARYASRYGYAQIAIKQGRVPLYRVLVGKMTSSGAAEQLADTLRSEVHQDFVVRLDGTELP
ncbi:MAG TPA: septal ring lytic transglycosylase RlpA family protein [Bryobacteraceae bacterium]|nr:septal ring lytic transglycosylase RlpA family protein [Bryobacteraceae bacterium]